MVQRPSGRRRPVLGSRNLLIAGLSMILLLSLTTPSFAAGAISLSPDTGPPTSTTTVTGSGFGSREIVDIFFDTAHAGRVKSALDGGFSTAITAPATALPGTHDVTATGETSGATASAPFLVRTDWPHFGFDNQHTDFNPYENVLDKQNVGSLAVKWRGLTGGRVNSSPAVADGYVFVGSFDKNLSAFSASCATGGGQCLPLWTGHTGDLIFSSPTVADGKVFVGSDDGKLYAFPEVCTNPCAPLWTFQTGADIRSSASVQDGVVYTGSHDGNLYAIDEATGVEDWHAVVGNGVRSFPVIAEGKVFVGDLSGIVAAYPAGPGCTTPCPPIWTAQTGGQVQGAGAYADGVFYIGSIDKKLYAFSASCTTPCAPLWTGTTGGDIRSSPGVNAGVVYVGSGDGRMYAFPTACTSPCQPLWYAQVGQRPVKSSPAIANGVVYVGSGKGNLFAFPAGPGCVSPCQKLWTQSTGGQVRTSPAVADGVVYAGSVDLNVYAFSIGGG